MMTVTAKEAKRALAQIANTITFLDMDGCLVGNELNSLDEHLETVMTFIEEVEEDGFL